MIKQKELASLIQKGLEMKNVFESKDCFFNDVYGKFHICALGAAVVGKFGSAQKAHELVEAVRETQLKFEERGLAVSNDYLSIAIELLEIDCGLANAVNKRHMHGVPAMTIAQQLEEGPFLY